MHLARRALHWLRATLGRRTLENDMQAEMREHLERTTERLIARGMSPADARIAARREFGNATAIEEEARDARGGRWVDALAGDMRFALRYFARHKATVAIIVAVLALGTGANALIFSFLQAQFLRPAPAVPDDARHARIWAMERPTRTASFGPRDFTRPELEALAARADLFTQVAAWVTDDVIINAGAGDSTGALGVGAQFVTPNFFATLGVRLAAGQGLAPEQRGVANMTAVMSYKMAIMRFGSVDAALGREVLVNERPVRIVGVAPERFQGALLDMNKPALWMPLSARADIDGISPRWLDDNASLSLFARMAPGASHEKATAFARQVVASTLPDSATRIGMSRTAHVLGMREMAPGTSGDAIIAITLLCGMGVLILLVAWTNVSSLIVAAAVGRRHEIAVRLSLGASRTRLLRQLVTESTMLALAGGLMGLLLAWSVLTYVQKTSVEEATIAPDVTTFVYVLVLAVVTGVVFGLSPALHATRDGVANALRDSGTASSKRSRLQRTFVVAQIVLSQPLLVLLGTMLTLVIGEYRPMAPELSRHVISIGFRPLERTGAASQRPEAVDSIVPRLAQRSEVLAAVAEADAFDVRRVVAPDRPATIGAQGDTIPTIVHMEGTAPGWFALLDVPLVLGRDVALSDTAARDRAVVIGSDLARVLWPSASPIGRALPSPVLLPGQDSVMLTVVGVYDASARLPGMTFSGVAGRSDVKYRVYTAHGKKWRHDRVLVRTRGPAAPIVPELLKFARATAPSMPVTSMRTLEQQDELAYRDALKVAGFAGGGGIVALLLASLGLYGVVSLAVQQRTREIGIRIAVGANPVRVAWLFLRSGVRVSAVALAIGLPVSVALLKIGMSRGVIIAPDVNPYLVGVAIAAILLGVAAAATWVPARRAARIDPATTLRVE